MEDDKIYEDYIAAFKRALVWCNGKYYHYEDVPEERLELEIQRVSSYLSTAKKQNWCYATSIMKLRYDGYKYITF